MLVVAEQVVSRLLFGLPLAHQKPSQQKRSVVLGICAVRLLIVDDRNDVMEPRRRRLGPRYQFVGQQLPALAYPNIKQRQRPDSREGLWCRRVTKRAAHCLTTSHPLPPGTTRTYPTRLSNAQSCHARAVKDIAANHTHSTHLPTSHTHNRWWPPLQCRLYTL